MRLCALGGPSKNVVVKMGCALCAACNASVPVSLTCSWCGCHQQQRYQCHRGCSPGRHNLHYSTEQMSSVAYQETQKATLQMHGVGSSFQSQVVTVCRHSIFNSPLNFNAGVQCTRSAVLLNVQVPLANNASPIIDTGVPRCCKHHKNTCAHLGYRRIHQWTLPLQVSSCW
jgi:hypothetical protein